MQSTESIRVGVASDPGAASQPVVRIEPAELLSAPLATMLTRARKLTESSHDRRVSYSRKVFIPLTRLCRDVCHYCTFATSPGRVPAPYLSADEVLAIARAGAAAGCREALFTLGDKPELRYPVARRALDRLGYESTIAYLAAMCELVLSETGLLPHANPGVMTGEDIASLRRVSVSQGLMLESSADRLCERGGVHFGSPDKRPAVRLETLQLAGEAAVPFTTGILIGIGETRAERIDALVKIRELHDRYGHIQEIIIQNFRAKPGTKLADATEPGLAELQWTIAAARIVFGPAMNIQAPPNLSVPDHGELIAAGINDWGGISPVTPDHVNPEKPWPAIEALARDTASAGCVLTERLAIYPQYVLDLDRWVDPRLRARVLAASDAEGYARDDRWQPGIVSAPPAASALETSWRRSGDLERVLQDALEGTRLDEQAIVRLFAARGDEVAQVCDAADSRRRASVGDVVTYAVNRNINYTNVCLYHCSFCAFSKGSHARGLRGPAYDLELDEIQRRVREAWARGATEVCMQGGIHPDYTGETYLALTRAVKQAVPQIHVHAFSPLEVTQGARTLGMGVKEYLEELAAAGLGSLPGTAAEILDDEVRDVICPDKLATDAWLGVIEAAHRCKLPTTATIMFGHVERPIHWARHLLRIRELQERTGGFTEFVPLPFVAMEAPMFRKGAARAGPTFREALLMHAVARLTLDPLIRNIQVSWVKMGPEGARACLAAGANDLGGTLMNESISRAAGTQHGQELPPAAMERLIEAAGRKPMQRTTRYGPVDAERRQAALNAVELAPVTQTAAGRRANVRIPLVERRTTLDSKGAP
jgi:FO synthase